MAEVSGVYDWHDESSPAVSAMIFNLMEAMGHHPTKEEAELLFLV